MIDSNNINLVKEMLRKNNTDLFIKAKDEIFNRKIIEYGKIKAIFGIENTSKENNLRNVESGLNEYLARTASKNGISIGIDLEEIRKVNKKRKGELLGKIKQNILLCRKEKANLLIKGFKDKRNCISFLKTLNASSQQTAKAIYF
jgi:hypothetical protein